MKLRAISDLLLSIPQPVDRGDDFNPAEYSGHNFDDAYQIGFSDGEEHLAQKIREILEQ